MNNLLLSVKYAPIGKPDNPDLKFWNDYNSGWQSKQWTQQRLIDHASKGYPIAPGTFLEGRKRKDNLIGALNLLVLEYDENWTDDKLDIFLNHPFIVDYAFLVHHSSSSKPGANRVKAFIQFNTSVSISDYSALCEYIGYSLAPSGADTASYQPNRAQFGDKHRRVPLVAAPGKTLDIAPILALVKAQQQQKRLAAKTFVFSDSENYFAGIERALGITKYDGRGWSNAIPCPFGNHAHDEKRPAAHWHNDSHILYCHKCTHSYLAKEVAAVYSIERPKVASTLPVIESVKLVQSFTPICLNHAFREFVTHHCVTEKRQNPAPTFLAVWEALLNAGVVPEKQLISIEQAVALTGYAYNTIARVFNGIGIYFQTESLNKDGVLNLTFEFGNKSETGKKGRPTYYYTIPDPRPFAKKCGISLLNAAALPAQVWGKLKEYKAYAMVANAIHEITTRIPMFKFEETFQFNVTDSLKLLEERGKIEITRDQVKRKPVDTGEIEEVVRDVLEAMAGKESAQSPLPADNPHKYTKKRRGFTGWFEMYTYEDGVKVPYCHKGGKSGKPNNRIPISLGAVKRFIDKAHFELVIRTSNLYRALETV